LNHIVRVKIKGIEFIRVQSG